MRRDSKEFFDLIVKKESEAKGYRKSQKREKRKTVLKQSPFFKVLIAFISARFRRKGKSPVKSYVHDRSRLGTDLALDHYDAKERKDLYIREDRIAVYTSLFGPYDTLKEPLLHPDNVDYYIFTDQPIPSGSLWKSLDIGPLLPSGIQRNPVACNRWCKFHPHLLFPDYQYSIYIDSNIWVFSDLTPLTASLDSFPVAMFRHKKRNCVYEEIQACLDQNKGDRGRLEQQVDELRALGIPQHWGLLEASVIARQHLDPACVSLMEKWWDSFMLGSGRDQISLIECLWRDGIDPYAIGTLGDNLQRCDLFLQMRHVNE